LVNTPRIAQGGIFQSQRPVNFYEPGFLRLQRFNAIAVLDGAEVLPGLSHDQHKQAAHGG
jgi:hypothetical protein